MAGHQGHSADHSWMLYPTHFTGGVVAFAAVATAAGITPEITLPSLFVAGVSGLVADLDNDEGTVLRHRRKFLAVALLFGPLAWGTDHRGRTHSLAGIGIFAAMCTLYAWLLTLALPEIVFADIYLIAAMSGYASHLLLDALNKPGVPLLWPSRMAFAFPPGRALWRLRMFADNPLQHVISLVGIAALGAWLGPHLGDIAVATINDPAIHGLGAGLYRVVSGLFVG